MDWVACWLFGKMINFTKKHLPRYCRDLKQILDDKAEAFINENSLRKWKSQWYGTNERCLADLKKS
jgi:hypothetical protein